MKTLFFLSLLLIAFPASDRRKQASPLDQLPANEEILTHFGERADFSPDNQNIVFMDKSFGDAFVIDLKTRTIRCLTCSIPGAAFLRVMHLSNGDYILIGPEKFTDVETSRDRDNELWFLSSKTGSKPERLNQRMFEGAAISKRSMLISFSEHHGDHPELPKDYSRLMVATVDLSQGTPRLTKIHKVYESSSDSCSIEAQDFYDNDQKMTFTCYVKQHQPTDPISKVMGIDLKTGKVTDFSQSPGFYNECEGIFPDGNYTAVESDRQVSDLGGDHGMHNIDIWKLRLDGTGKDWTRLTNFNDFAGWKASNPVISTDGKLMAFQVARTTDRAGVGYGIVLHHLD